MITYEIEKSPFFEANKSYVEKLETQLKALNAECSGFCNSFGYEIETSINRNNLLFKLTFKKSQSTQNGVVIPVNAYDDFEADIMVSGFNTKLNLSFGKSKIKRVLISAALKEKFPSPYFISFNTPPSDNFTNPFS